MCEAALDFGGALGALTLSAGGAVAGACAAEPDSGFVDGKVCGVAGEVCGVAAGVCGVAGAGWAAGDCSAAGAFCGIAGMPAKEPRSSNAAMRRIPENEYLMRRKEAPVTMVNRECAGDSGARTLVAVLVN